MSGSLPWKLAVFDFDNTIIDLNVYYLINDLLKQNVPENLNEIQNKLDSFKHYDSIFDKFLSLVFKIDPNVVGSDSKSY